MRTALKGLAVPAELTEWDQLAPGAPDRIKRYGSPTVLVNGEDITGVGEGAGATCCAAGAPTVDTIRAALETTA